MYCGNNSNYPGLLDGSLVLGSNLECLRKGIGVGRHLPVDEDQQSYEQIDDRKFYCGDQDADDIDMSDYIGVGSPYRCLSIGVGVGKAIAAEESRRESGSDSDAIFRMDSPPRVNKTVISICLFYWSVIY